MADNVIDSLSIQIDSNARGASRAIDNVISKLDKLDSAIAGFNTSGIDNLTSTFKNLGTAAESLKNLSGIGNFSSVFKNLEKIAGINSAGLLNASTAINQLGASAQNLQNLSDLSVNIQQFSDIATAVSKLGRAGVQNAAKNIAELNPVLSAFLANISALSTASANINGLGTLAESISKLGRSTVTQAAQNIPQLTNVLSQFVKEMNNLQAVTFDITGLSNLVSSISKLGGKNSTNAAANIKSITTELSKMLTELSKAPRISENTIRMTEALSRVSGRTLNTGNSARTATPHIRSLSNAIGNLGTRSRATSSLLNGLWARLRNVLALRVSIKGLWGAIEKSMNFLEDYNYFQAAFQQVADKSGDGWKEAGYNSAEEYAESFSKRARELTSKMSGFDVSDVGTLTANKSGKSLGMDPSMLLNYQATFAQISSSMGATSEQAEKLSKALTMIGADLASVKNENFSKVYENMSSGLVGMSRAVDKYGANIRVANLQQMATNLGIQTSVSKMDQASKAMLRTIVILDSTRYAWADMANTINMPANQLRILQSNLVACARALGNIFLPIVAKVLPYINGLVIAFQRLLTYIGGLLGVNDKIGSMFSGIGGGSDNLSNALDSLDNTDLSGVTDSTSDTNKNLKNAAKNAKKLKQFLASYDELEVMSKDSSLSDLASSKIKTPTVDTSALDSGILNTALDKLLDEYQKKWDAAYNSMENKAMAFANKVTDAFRKLAKAAEPTTKALKNLWNNGLKQLRNFTWTALKDFWKHFLVPLGKWTLGEKGLPRLINAFNDFLVKINWDKINASLVKLWDVLEPFAENVGTGLLDFFDDFFDKAAGAVNKLPDLIDRFREFIATFSPDQAQSIGYFLGQLLTAFVAFKGLTWFGSIFGKDGAIGKGFAMLSAHPYAAIVTGIGLTVAALDKFGVIDVDWQGLWDRISRLKDVIVDFIGNIDWDSLIKTIGDVWDVFQPFAEGFADAFIEFFDIMLNDIGAPLINALASALDAVAKTFGKLDDKQIEAIGHALGQLLIIKGTVKFTKNIWNVVSSIRGLRTIFSGIGGVLSTASTALQSFFGSGLGSTLAAGFADSMAILAAAMAGFNLGKWISVNLFGGEDKTFVDFMKDNVLGYQKGDFTGALDEFFKDIFHVGDNLTEDDLAIFQEYEDAILGLVRASQLSGEQAYPLLTYLSELKNNGYSTEQALTELEARLENLGISADTFEQALEGVNQPVKELGTTAQESSNQFSNMADRINNVSFEDISDQLSGFQNLIQTIDFATLVTDTANAIDEMGGIWENGKQVLGEKALQIYQEISKGLEPDENGYYTLANGQMVQFGKGISDYEGTLQNTMDSTLENAINGVLDENSGFELLTELGKNQIIACGDGIEQNGSKVTDKLENVIETAGSEAGGTAKTSGKEIGENSIKGILQGYQNQQEVLGNATTNLFDNYVKKKAQTSLDSHSPSRWFEQLAKFCGQGFNNGLEPGFSSTFTWFGSFRTRISNSIGNLYNIGWNAIIGLNNGIVGAAQNLFSNVHKIASNVAQSFRNVLKIHSPSQVFEEIGGYTMEGFQIGMQKMVPALQNTIGEINTSIQDIEMPQMEINTKQIPQAQIRQKPMSATSTFGDDIRREVIAISNNTFDNNQNIAQIIREAVKGMAIYADGHLVGYLQEEDRQHRNRSGFGLFEG